MLAYLHLDHNDLQGPIPPGFSNMGVLNQLDVSSNNLSGAIPGSGKLPTFPAPDYGNNPYLCGTPLPACDAGSASSDLRLVGNVPFVSASLNTVRIGISTCASVVLLVLIPFICYYLRNSLVLRQYVQDDDGDGAEMMENNNWNARSSDVKQLSINVATFEPTLQKYDYEKLKKATNGFSKEDIIGSGGFGVVYKATLEDGKVLAVKKLIHVKGEQGDRAFSAEMETIGKINHRNLVRLLGYCKLGQERMLVYEYMVGGSLENRLHGSPQYDTEGQLELGAQSRSVLSWEMRKRWAIGTAKGLNFLHNVCIPNIIHRDLKSANVLLDDADEPRVSDFGMARLVSASETHLSVSSVVGTPGYVPPEYSQSVRCTTKGDVYSFGVILLELITGRSPTSFSTVSATCRGASNGAAQVVTKQDECGLDLAGWVKERMQQGRHREVLDQKALNGEESIIGPANLQKREKEMLAYLHLALQCASLHPNRRPCMLRVMAFLKELSRDFEPDG